MTDPMSYRSIYMCWSTGLPYAILNLYFLAIHNDQQQLAMACTVPEISINFFICFLMSNLKNSVSFSSWDNLFLMSRSCHDWHSRRPANAPAARITTSPVTRAPRSGEYTNCISFFWRPINMLLKPFKCRD
jgi:hypothetical protein